MELIAASRIVKAQQRVAAARPYSEQITEVIKNLAAAGAGTDHPLLKPREEIRKVGYVVVTADRGLAGAYNSSVIRAAERSLTHQQRDRGRDYSLVLLGKKAQNYFRYRNYDIDASFTGMSDTPTYENAREVAKAIVEPFVSGEVDRVELVYTQFLSAGTQRVVVRRFLPLDTEALEEAAEGDGPKADYEF